MHGRLKVRTTEEQKLIKQKEQQKKLQAYNDGMEYIHSTRYDQPYNKRSLLICAGILERSPDVYTLWNFRKEIVEQEINKLSSKHVPKAGLLNNNKQVVDSSAIYGVVNFLSQCFQQETTEEIVKLMEVFQVVEFNEELFSNLNLKMTIVDEYVQQLSGVITWLTLCSWQNSDETNKAQLKKYFKHLHDTAPTETNIPVSLTEHLVAVINIIGGFIPEESNEIFKIENIRQLLHCLKEMLKWCVVQLIERELELTERCLLTNPKSYGAWHHRFWILERHPQPQWEKEMQLVEKYLKYDDRNFHTWDYRRLLLKRLNCELDAELHFSTEKININFSNYSSWHYRSTLNSLTPETVNQELNLVKNAVFTDPYDSSTWFYLRWVLTNEAVTAKHREVLLDDFEQLLQLEPDCKWIYMAKSWIQGSISLSNIEEVTKNVAVYRKLMELDPLRKGMYQDYFKLGAGNL